MVKSKSEFTSQGGFLLVCLLFVWRTTACPLLALAERWNPRTGLASLGTQRNKGFRALIPIAVLRARDHAAASSPTRVARRVAPELYPANRHKDALGYDVLLTTAVLFRCLRLWRLDDIQSDNASVGFGV